MKSLKKLVIMILVIIIVLTTESSEHYVYANQYLNTVKPTNVAVFFDNANAMYISNVKGCLENIEAKNKNKVKFTYFNAKDNQSIQNESIEKALNRNYDVFIIGIVSQNLKDVESTLGKVMKKIFL